jgi:hypothetical protein
MPLVVPRQCSVFIVLLRTTCGLLGCYGVMAPWSRASGSRDGRCCPPIGVRRAGTVSVGACWNGRMVAGPAGGAGRGGGDVFVSPCS